MAMTMQGEVALQTVDTVVRAAPGLPAHSAAFQSFEKVSDAARELNDTRGTQSKSKFATACTTLIDTGAMRAIDRASRDGALCKADTFAITAATYVSTILAPSRLSALSVSMRL